MVNAVFAVPYREADARRAELFQFTTAWIRKHHKHWPMYAGSSPDGPFNRGAAINDAAKHAGDDWDVLIVHDADNIADPATLGLAAQCAADTGKVVYPFRTYVYLDEFSTNRSMRQDVWFVAPEEHSCELFEITVRLHHYSGIQCIPRQAYEQVGGFIALTGWGAEDAIMHTLFDVYANGSEWLDGAAYHLWHPAKRNDPHDQYNVRNRFVRNMVQRLAVNNRVAGMPNGHAQSALRAYLKTQGHIVP